MTPNRRIFLNIAATYGRSLYALVLGLFTARWALMALGQVDFGLMGTVGGLVAFISFFNGLIATAVARFYAVSIGKASVPETAQDGLDDCRKWFSTAVLVHTVVPTALMLVGYPIGIWCVKSFLTIPADRVADCVWVFRFVCITCLLSMVSVPVNAMYQAKQYIAELTVYSFATTSLNALFLYYMVTHPGVWLARYAFWTCCLAVIPQLIIFARGFALFRECRLIPGECLSLKRICKMLYFVGWWAIGQGGGLLRSQGIQMLVNKYFGPKANAAMSVATGVNSHTMTLSGAMTGAFQPAIVSAYGAGDVERMQSLAYRACKFAMLFVLVFSVPLGLELREILRVWLVNPPTASYGLCLVMLVMTVIDQSSVGHMLAVNARGRIAKYQSLLGGALVMTLPIAWLFCAMGCNVHYVGFSMLATMAFCAWGRVWFARNLVNMSVRHWLMKIVAPVFVLAVASVSAGFAPRLLMGDGLPRIFATSAVCEVVLLVGAWKLVLDRSEREYIQCRFMRIVKRGVGDA